MVLASQMVQVTIEAMSSPIRTDFTTGSALRYMPQGVRSDGPTGLCAGTAALTGGATGVTGGASGTAGAAGGTDGVGCSCAHAATGAPIMTTAIAPRR